MPIKAFGVVSGSGFRLQDLMLELSSRSGCEVVDNCVLLLRTGLHISDGTDLAAQL